MATCTSCSLPMRHFERLDHASQLPGSHWNGQRAQNALILPLRGLPEHKKEGQGFSSYRSGLTALSEAPLHDPIGADVLDSLYIGPMLLQTEMRGWGGPDKMCLWRFAERPGRGTLDPQDQGQGQHLPVQRVQADLHADDQACGAAGARHGAAPQGDPGQVLHHPARQVDLSTSRGRRGCVDLSHSPQQFCGPSRLVPAPS
jgi:hypothetical protein